MKTVISYASRIKSICFILFFFLPLFFPISQLHCEPHRLLGEEGAQLRICEDSNGGCYVLTGLSILAVNDQGELREDWQWHEEMPEGLYFRSSPNGFWADGVGGLWYNFNDENENWVMNHFDCEGNALWEEHRLPENLPENYDHYAIKIGYEGGALCGFIDYDSDESGIFLMTEQGRYAGDRYQHIITQTNDANLIDSEAYLLENGDIYLQYMSRRYISVT